MITSGRNDERKLHRGDRIMSLKEKEAFQWIELVERIPQWGEESWGDREEECEQKQNAGKRQSI